MEMEQDLRSVLMWMLWHHQGSGSLIGQPIRRALGMKSTQPMNDAQIAEAKAFGGIFGNCCITQAQVDPNLQTLTAPRMERLPPAPLIKVPTNTRAEEVAKLEAAGYVVLRTDAPGLVSVTEPSVPPAPIVLPLGLDANIALRCAIDAIARSPTNVTAAYFADNLAKALKS